MKALARFGKAFGGYRLIDVPEPEIGDEDLLVRVRAATICGADMKHFRVEADSDVFNSIRGHELAGDIVQVGSKVTDWKVGQRVVSDNSGHVCGVCPACENADFLVCEHKTNIGLDNNRWGGGFTKYVVIPGEILRIKRHAIWEIPENMSYEEACACEPLANSYKSICQQTSFLPGQDVVVFGAGPLGLYTVQLAKIMGAVNIVLVGLDADEDVRFPKAIEFGATHVINAAKEDVVARCQEICGKDNLGLVIECSGANIALKQAIEMVRPNAEIVPRRHGVPATGLLHQPHHRVEHQHHRPYGLRLDHVAQCAAAGLLRPALDRQDDYPPLRPLRMGEGLRSHGQQGRHQGRADVRLR